MKIKSNSLLLITILLIISIGFFVMMGIKGHTFLALVGLGSIWIFESIMFVCFIKKIIKLSEMRK